MADDGSSDRNELEMLERILVTENAESFRRFLRERLDLRPDDAVLSVGCGPGFETSALAEDVGEDGRIRGVDVNEAVLAAARDRCRDLPGVTFEPGAATDLPVPDESYDVAVAKQVLQFVSDVDAALDELYRVLEPAGRVAVTGGDVDARVMHSSDRGRMDRVNEAYRNARTHPHLGTRLRSALPDAGFTVEEIAPRVAVQTEINEQVERGIEVQRGVLEADDSFEQSEIEAWERDLRDLDEAGEFLSCGTQFLYVGRKPA